MKIVKPCARIACAWLVLFSLGLAQDAVSYTVSRGDVRYHLINVQVRFPAIENAVVSLPVWSPGSYQISNYLRGLEGLVAHDRDGTPLKVERIAKSSWRIAGTSKGFDVSYQVNGRRSGKAPHVDDRNLYFAGPEIFVYLHGAKSRPCELKVEVDQEHKIATGLRNKDSATTFWARDYDELIDCPLLASKDLVIREYTAGGKSHRIAIRGPLLNLDLDRFTADCKKFSEYAIKMMGNAPFDQYTFIVFLGYDARGGLEHRNSTVIGGNSRRFDQAGPYDDFIWVAAHEYFHLWNVKRIRPIELGPFDYQKEVHTKMLWLAEGVTSFYSDIIMARGAANGWDEDRLIQQLGYEIDALQSFPGRKKMSVEASSFGAWVRPERHEANWISYYNKGHIVGQMLDFLLRAESEGKSSLDDVMRAADEFCAKKNRGLTPAEFQALAQQFCKTRSLDSFFADYVSGTKEIPYQDFLTSHGLKLVVKESEPRSGLGIRPRMFLRMSRSYQSSLRSFTPMKTIAIYDMDPNGPAALGGLRVGDSIQRIRLAPKALPIAAIDLWAELSELPADKTIYLDVNRGTEDFTVALKPRVERDKSYLIERDATASKEALELRRLWSQGR